jgi:thiol-disulfide isomerase/thioredoxin
MASEDSFSLSGATEWLNSPPLTAADLRGRVVLVNFWTYTCINWIRYLPHVRAWVDSYGSRGLVVIGVHSPEFSFEHDVDSVRRAVLARSLGYPIAIDNDFAVWRSFDNHYWPAAYLVDPAGRVRHSSFGESGYDETEAVLRLLLTEAGADEPEARTAAVSADGDEAPADWDTLRSAETYLGYGRGSGFASPGGFAADTPQAYSAPPGLRRGEWALSGTWTSGQEAAVSQAPGARLSCRFHSRDVHLVMAPERGSAVPFRVLLDGREPGADSGTDIDAGGRGTVTEPRMYQLLRRGGQITDATVEIEFPGPGAGIYCLTFG